MAHSADLSPLLDVSVADALGQLRAVPITLPDAPNALLLVHSEDDGYDPAPDHFGFPEDSLTLTLLDADGTVHWSTDLGKGVVPGIWFCPVFPFDLDSDGASEVWCVTTDDPDHQFNTSAHRLTRVDAETGEITNRWEWPRYPPGRQSLKFRNFILGGHVGGDPVLVTARGTYADMYLQAWDADMSRRWELEFPAHDPEFFETTADRNWTIKTPKETPGARGSHMCPVLDIDGDGNDELLWGERLIDLEDGTERWCADQETWSGHSDVVQPTLDRDADEWLVFTCRESYDDISPRVVMYDDAGKRVWSDIEEGHMHVGWTARLGPDGEHVAMAGRNKGSTYADMDEFLWEATAGNPRDIEYPVYSTTPVDVDGDGRHELVYRMFEREGRVINADGETLGTIEGTIAHCQPSKFLDHPGEQIITYTEDGRVRVWGDRNAVDVPAAQDRYEHPYYRKAQRLSAVGYNGRNLGGL